MRPLVLEDLRGLAREAVVGQSFVLSICCVTTRLQQCLSCLSGTCTREVETVETHFRQEQRGSHPEQEESMGNAPGCAVL